MAVYPEQRLPWILFGDGGQGQLLTKKFVGPNEEGVNMSEIQFRPTEEMMKLHGIPRSDLDVEFSLTYRYPTSMIVTLSEDPVNATMVILCDVKGRPTKLTDLQGALLETLMGYEKRIKALQAQNAWLHAEMRKMTSHMQEYIKQNADMFLSAIKVRGKIDEPFGAAEDEQQQ